MKQDQYKLKEAVGEDVTGNGSSCRSTTGQTTLHSTEGPDCILLVTAPLFY